jgi:hypothetical protein
VELTAGLTYCRGVRALRSLCGPCAVRSLCGSVQRVSKPSKRPFVLSRSFFAGSQVGGPRCTAPHRTALRCAALHTGTAHSFVHQSLTRVGAARSGMWQSGLATTLRSGAISLLSHPCSFRSRWLGFRSLAQVCV